MDVGIKIDNFTFDSKPMPFECAPSSITLLEEFMMQKIEVDVIEIHNAQGASSLNENERHQ